jgi:predicted GIY-YIG superfamily endonuclease
MALVYKHIRLDTNNPFYIGIGKTEKRAFSKHRRNKYWKSITSKTNYEVEILFDNLSWEECCVKEIELIKLYGRKDNGTGILVNMTDGGEGSLGIIKSDEVRKKLSECQSGDKHYFYGKSHSDETKEKLSIKLKGRIISEESRKKMSETHKKMTISEETRKKMAESLRGKPRSEETKEKIRQSLLRR